MSPLWVTNTVNTYVESFLNIYPFSGLSSIKEYHQSKDDGLLRYKDPNPSSENRVFMACGKIFPCLASAQEHVENIILSGTSILWPSRCSTEL